MQKRIHYFLAIAEELNLRRAAVRLGVSQPALSKHLASLEDELGFDLFVRDGQRISALSPAGEKFLANVCLLSGQVQAGIAAARRIGDGHRESVRIGFCEEVVAASHLWPLVTTSREPYFRSEIEFIEYPILAVADAVRRFEIDIGLVVLPVKSQGLDVQPLWQERWVAILPLEHRFAERSVLACEDLQDEALILGTDESGAGAHYLIRSAFMTAGIVPRVSMSAQRRSTLLTLATAGAGITFMPAPLGDLALPGLVAVPMEIPNMRVAALQVSNRRMGRDGEIAPILRILSIGAEHGFGSHTS